MAPMLQTSVRVAVCVLLFTSFPKADAAAKRRSVELTEENWTDILQGEWMVKFYAPWCPACKSLEPAWDKFADWGDDLDISVGEVDVTTEPGLSGRFMVTSLPSIYHVINGEFRRYMGPRSKDDLMTFVEERKHIEIEPVSSWRAPNSLAMGLLSWLFKVSMVVRNIHTTLTEDYNVPVYGSYALFAAATILMGLLLGVALVFLTDYLCPARPPKCAQQRIPPKDQRSQSSDSRSNSDADNEETSENTEDIDSSISDVGLRHRKTNTEHKKEEEQDVEEKEEDEENTEEQKEDEPDKKED
ncbi:thioredoxin-related transmembrane protein 1-like isoform X1 [Glandiceps talaboti]